MTYEQAQFFKILLSLGYCEELSDFINTALETQDPLSEIILELAFAENDLNTLVSLLSQYISDADTGIDYDGEVFSMLLEFLRKKRKAGMSVKEMSTLMYRAAMLHPDCWDSVWYSMYIFDDYIEFYTEQKANDALDAFLEHGVLPKSPWSNSANADKTFFC